MNCRHFTRTLFLAAYLAASFSTPPSSAEDGASHMPNAGSQLAWDGSAGIWRLKWWGMDGHTYFIQQSETLTNWANLPMWESGVGSMLEYGFETDAVRLFLRIKSTDTPTDNPATTDFDGDGVETLDELLNGTDPLANPDSDNDGFPDDWEIDWFGHINVASPLNQHKKDSDGDGVPDDVDAFPHDYSRQSALSDDPEDPAGPAIELLEP